MKLKWIAIAALAALSGSYGCGSSKNIGGNDSSKEPASLEEMMRKEHGIFDSVLAHRKDWNVQIIYTKIDRNASNDAVLTDYTFNLDSGYFYPASTVKLPIALLALEKINDLKVHNLNRRSVMITDSGYSGQGVVYNDPTSPTGAPTIEHYIKKIFLVSDNDAFNRLYEFLGRRYINKRLNEDMGYGEVEILHRLAIFLTQEENKHTNPVRFFDEKGNFLYGQPLLYDEENYKPRKDSIGKAYMSGNGLVPHAMDFSFKNRISLSTLHNILRSIYFPSAVEAKQRFRLTDDDLSFVKRYMSEFPSESKYPSYDTSYQDAYGKFLLFGAGKGKIPSNIRVFNKIGDAYGSLVDVAYVVDLENKVEFMLSATMYCNADGILNDDQYDYQTIGLPFMKALGTMIYNYELKRKRKYRPDLSSLQFSYE